MKNKSYEGVGCAYVLLERFVGALVPGCSSSADLFLKFGLKAPQGSENTSVFGSRRAPLS